jgi:hypothetical protein
MAHRPNDLNKKSKKLVLITGNSSSSFRALTTTTTICRDHQKGKKEKTKFKVSFKIVLSSFLIIISD